MVAYSHANLMSGVVSILLLAPSLFEFLFLGNLLYFFYGKCPWGNPLGNSSHSLNGF